jgi:ABC-type phosphate transport system ATPase subunit
MSVSQKTFRLALWDEPEQERVRCSKLYSGAFLKRLEGVSPEYTCSSTVELRGGKVEIDGQNIRDIGLSVLRSRLALVPQDGTLFLGTLRENL